VYCVFESLFNNDHWLINTNSGKIREMWGALGDQTNDIKQHSLHISAFVLTVVIETIVARIAYFLSFFLVKNYR